MYQLTLLERTSNILQKYLYLFPIDIGMDNLATKPSPLYVGSVNGLSDEQTFNMNHKYIYPDMV